MQCDKCRKSAVIGQQYSGLHLCEQHFVADFETKAKRAIRTHRWLSAGDHIAVALSGGNGSSALLHFLKDLTGRRRDITLSAINIDEGIAGYRDLTRAVKIAASLDIPCITGSFADDYGTTLDAIVQEKGSACACQYCSILKRSLLSRIAREHGVSRLALGSSLDDEAESVLTDVLSGDMDRLLCREHVPEGSIPLIRPFMYIPEQEVALYSQMKSGRAGPLRCPHAGTTLRADAGMLLDVYTGRHPSAPYAVVRLMERISRAGGAVQDRIPRCGRCGEPARDTCQSCRILSEVPCHAQ